jgi:hypothetical protein
MAAARGIRLAGGAREEKQDPGMRRLTIPLSDAATEPDDLGAMERFLGIGEHLPARDGRIRLDDLIPA